MFESLHGAFAVYLLLRSRSITHGRCLENQSVPLYRKKEKEEEEEEERNKRGKEKEEITRVILIEKMFFQLTPRGFLGPSPSGFLTECENIIGSHHRDH